LSWLLCYLTSHKDSLKKVFQAKQLIEIQGED
jgi:hypothetical protein